MTVSISTASRTCGSAVLLVLAACSSAVRIQQTPATTTATHLDAKDTVPWLDEPGVPNQRLAWAHTLPTSATSAPACALNALHLEADLNAGMGQIYGQLWVHNVGSSACAVQGLPDVDLLNDDGIVIAHTDPALARTDRSAPVVLAPDSWALAALGLVATSNPGLCSNSPAFSHLRVRWSEDTMTIAYSGGGRNNPDCPQPTVPTSPSALFGTSAFAAIPESSDYRYQSLTARIDAPASVRPGDTLRYTVSLVNSSETNDVFLWSPSDCPIYLENLDGLSGEFLLNCGAADVLMIPKGEAIRFEMELGISTSTPAGPATLSWQTTEPTGLSDTATVNVLPVG